MTFPKKIYKQTHITTPTESYVTNYPEFIKLAETQLEKCFWTANEIDVAKDKQDMLVNMLPEDRHRVQMIQKLFVKYELFVGNEYWLTKIIKTYPRPEIQRMASVFGMVELAVHAPFYNKLNEVLGNNTDEFYTSYTEDKVLAERMRFLDSVVECEDELLSLATFSMMEGAILFSSFAFFKGFQSNGNNQIPNVVRGINQSVIDEGLHQTAGAVIFNIRVKQLEMSAEELSELHQKIRDVATVIYDHECRIVDMLYPDKNDKRGEDLKQFVASRVNICLSDLGIVGGFVVLDNPIAEWFYASAQQYQMIDFFTGMGREYVRSWDETKFVWKTKNNKESE